MNVTTKDPSRTRYTVDALYRYEPPQSKAFNGLGGQSLNKCTYPTTQGDCDSWFIRPFLDPEVPWDGTNAWDSYTQNQYSPFEGWNALAERLNSEEGGGFEQLGVSEEQGFSAGVGFQYELRNVHIGADYAYTDFGVFGTVNRIGLQIGL